MHGYAGVDCRGLYLLERVGSDRLDAKQLAVLLSDGQGRSGQVEFLDRIRGDQLRDVAEVGLADARGRFGIAHAALAKATGRL